MNYCDQYNKGITSKGLPIYCNCNNCKKYINKICTHYKTKVLDETAGCVRAIIRKWV